jgi:hypothetical protein
MKRTMFTIVAATTLALMIHGGIAPRLLAQPPPPTAENPPLPPGAWMGHPGMGGPGMMGGGPNRPSFSDLMASRYRHLREMEQPGCGGMDPEIGMGPGMGMMGMGIPSDAKSQAQMLQLRGKMMQMWGEWMEKRGKELEQQAK